MTKLLMVAAFALATGCGAEVSAEGGFVEASEPPPTPTAIVEVQTASPGAEYFWVAGYHRWVGGRYAWVGGRWERRPHARATWRAPRWEQRGRRQVWIEGRWE